MRIKRRVLVLLAVIVIASAGMGISYATNGGGIGGVPSYYCDVAFIDVSASDNEYVKEVADVTAQIINEGSGIYVGISNAYPRYEAYIDFTITNQGNKPINVDVVASDYEDTALDIDVAGVEEGDVLGMEESLYGTLTVLVLQGAEQNTVYDFTVSFGFYNEECPQYTYVETVIVDADNPDPTLSTADLELGVGYTLVATGTAFAGGKYTEDIEFDAKYSITHSKVGDTWTDSVTDYESWGSTLLDLFVNGDPGGWGVFNADHQYECTIIGNGFQVELWIYDIYYPNNVGSLTVDIYEIS